MKKENLLYSTFILTISSIATRIIGMVFRIYLSNQIGSVGMGLYQMILSVYGFAATFATSGVAIAVSNLVSAHIARKESKAARYILRFSLLLSILLGVSAGSVLFLFAEPISLYLIQDQAAALSLRLLAPGLVFMAVSACLRGYFLAVSKVSKPAIAMIIEQLSRMAIITAFMTVWLPLGITYACAAAVIGMSISEAISTLYLYIAYLRNKASLFTNEGNQFLLSRQSLIGSVMKIAIPVAFSSYLQSTLRLVENILLPDSLKKYAQNDGDGLGVYGALKGMTMPLLMFPSVFLSSLSISLVPEISRSASINDTRNLNHILNRVIKITLLCSVMVVAVFFTFSHEIAIAIYHNNEVGEMLKLLAPLCPFIYLEIVVSGILKGLNEQFSSLRYNTVDSVLRIVLIFLLVPSHGLYSFIGIMYLSNIYTSTSSVLRLLKVTSLSFRLKDWLLKPIIAALISALFFKGVFRFFIPSGVNVWFSLALSILFLCVGYLFILLITGCITLHELKWLRSRFHFPALKKADELNVSPKV